MNPLLPKLPPHTHNQQLQLLLTPPKLLRIPPKQETLRALGQITLLHSAHLLHIGVARPRGAGDAKDLLAHALKARGIEPVAVLERGVWVGAHGCADVLEGFADFDVGAVGR